MKPILFNGEMVRAILWGRKTQTRRRVKGELRGYDPMPLPDGSFETCADWCVSDEDKKFYRADPPHKKGDILYVREAFCVGSPDRSSIVYRASPPYTGFKDCFQIKWRPSIHMPKWSARTFLEVTNVRLERIFEISEAAAKAEGVPLTTRGEKPCHKTGFLHLWEQLYGEDSLEDFVWVYEFKVLKENPVEDGGKS